MDYKGSVDASVDESCPQPASPIIDLSEYGSPTVAGSPAASGPSPAEELFISIMVGGEGPRTYDAYRRLHALAPVLRTQAGVLVLTRYEDCDAALRHRGLGKARVPLAARRAASIEDESTRRALAWIRRSMLFTDPPDHTRLRRLVSSAFTARHVEGLEQAISRRADQLLDGLAAHPGEDFMAAVALPLPVNVIADLLGVPEADRNSLTRLIHDVTALLEPLVSDEALARAVIAHAELSSYLGGLLSGKRREPAADLGLRRDRLRAGLRLGSAAAVPVLLHLAANCAGPLASALARSTGLPVVRLGRASPPKMRARLRPERVRRVPRVMAPRISQAPWPRPAERAACAAARPARLGAESWRLECQYDLAWWRT